MGDVELAGEGTFKWDAGGVGSWGGSIGVGYKLTNNLHNSFSEGTVEDVNGGDGGVPGQKDGIAVGILLMGV
jgi:hypothetical protein